MGILKANIYEVQDPDPDKFALKRDNVIDEINRYNAIYNMPASITRTIKNYFDSARNKNGEIHSSIKETDTQYIITLNSVSKRIRKFNCFAVYEELENGKVKVLHFAVKPKFSFVDSNPKIISIKKNDAISNVQNITENDQGDILEAIFYDIRSVEFERYFDPSKYINKKSRTIGQITTDLNRIYTNVYNATAYINARVYIEDEKRLIIHIPRIKGLDSLSFNVLMIYSRFEKKIIYCGKKEYTIRSEPIDIYIELPR